MGLHSERFFLAFVCAREAADMCCISVISQEINDQRSFCRRGSALCRQNTQAPNATSRRNTNARVNARMRILIQQTNLNPGDIVWLSGSLRSFHHSLM